MAFVADGVFVGKSQNRGRGVFTKATLKKNVIIEIAPVIVMTATDRTFLDQTLLHDYIFEWGEKRDLCCMALGYIALYNHSFESNCEYEMDFNHQVISVRTIRAIEEGEELFINYNGDWNNDKKLWFEAK